MKLLTQVFFIARLEGKFFARFPKLAIAVAVVVLIPAIYVVIYLSSVWDPAAHTGSLAVGLVNKDQGMVYREQEFNVGKEVVAELKSSARFGYRSYSDEEEARRLVRQGKLAFALIIPPEFSANAVPGTAPGAGKPVIFASEGNNYESAAIARHFAEALGHRVNEQLNEKRWALVLHTAAGSQHSVDRLREGVALLNAGAKKLAKGAEETATGAKKISSNGTLLTDGVGQLTSGFKQLGAGLKTMHARLPSNNDLNRLKRGADTLTTGHRELGKGLSELQNGGKQLHSGVQTFYEEAKQSIFVSSETLAGVEKLADGLGQMDSGLAGANNAQKKLTDGAVQLGNGVGTLVNGVRTLGTGIQTAVSKLPADEQLDELDKGTTDFAAGTQSVSKATMKLASGAQQLSLGIEQLTKALPANISKPDGSAKGLANSVQPEIEIHAKVANSGSGFSPNVIPGALWLGAGIAAFLLHVRVLPYQAESFSRPAQFLGKLFIPGCVVLLQALCVFLTVRYALKIHIDRPDAFILTLAVASLTFLVIVFALTKAFGDAGKGMAMILLAVQLSSSGGILPVELSGGWYMYISPWLPLTWVVKAIKATMFGAYDGAWQYPLLLVFLAGVVTTMLACVLGRWRFVNPDTIRPAVDI